MTGKKLVSVRIDEHDLKMLDEICDKYSSLNRSDLIQKGVMLITQAQKKGCLKQVTSFRPQFGDECIKFVFEYGRKIS